MGTRSVVLDEGGAEYAGLNVGSQDYLGLANHPRVAEAAIEAIERHGVHSSGSAPMGGGSVAARQLEARISAELGVAHTMLFPTGWAAGYGVIRGIVRAHDFIVMDALAHNCLQHGAQAATPNVTLFSHNSPESLERRVSRIRRDHPDAAILIVTESLFSMDSDSPPIEAFIDIRDRYDAHLLIDIAHDFGVLGPGGRGIVAGRASYANLDFIVGSFSKTFASIGGFFSTNDVNLVRGVQGYSGSYTFSNYLIPPQVAAVSEAMRITFSPEGDRLRGAVLDNCRHLRTALLAEGVKPLGAESAMVIIEVGDEALARRTYRNLLDDGVILNCVEYPAVKRGSARFRVQLTPGHSKADLDELARKLTRALVSSRATNVSSR